MNPEVRESVKMLLFNSKNELLMIHVDDPAATSPGGQYFGPFWTPIGGTVEPGETLIQTACREVYEETGIFITEADCGPVIWYGEFQMILKNRLIHFKQKFIPIRTSIEAFSLANLTEDEQKVVRGLKWFSEEELRNLSAVIFPVVLMDYLPPIFKNQLPQKPLKIDLAKQPY